ncbi:PAS domain S-box-containing protein [Elusimicrobium simillimum]|uniref:ATP-binding protein n=1 Tax=Elusimicrobium simillimum TaxID=3143438 RepID=UPI003C6EEA49
MMGLKRFQGYFNLLMDNLLNRFGLGMRTKLIIIFLVVKVIPLVLLTAIAWRQMNILGDSLRDIAVSDSTAALNSSATENIERMTTDTAGDVAKFLYERDSEILYLSKVQPTQENYRAFIENRVGKVIVRGKWKLADDGMSWVEADREPIENEEGVSTNKENNDRDGFHYRYPDHFKYKEVPLYDEVAFIDLDGNEVVKVTTPNTTKTRYPLSPVKKNISNRLNTYIKAETHFPKLKKLKPGEIFVSDVIGAYTKSNYIGMYTPKIVEKAAKDRGYDIPYKPEEQSYAGMENPNGVRFEGIVRWATPVTGADGKIKGYVTFALNHDHIMEYVDHNTPMNERYTELPDAYDGNYSFIWDYKGRSICHPRHHSIVGFDPETGEPEIPWLESSIYEAWQKSDVKKWTDFVKDWPTFDHQSREKKPALALTKAGLVGLDCRYLNNAPQCTGWMDLTRDGGSGSFYILWSGLYKLTTAAAIPYYTGQYAPSAENGYSKRGFAFVAIGAGLEDFTRPAKDTELKLVGTIEKNLTQTFFQLIITTALLILVVVLIAIWLAWTLMDNITRLISGVSRFRAGERQFRFNAPVKDEFGQLADSFDDMADSIVDSVKNPLSITDMNLNIIYMNDQALALAQKTLAEVVGTSYTQNSVYPVGSKYCPITALQHEREAEIYYVENSGRYVRGTANYFLNKQGEKIGYIVVTNDVTEMLLERNKIEEQRILLDKVFSASPDLIWYEDAKGKYLTVNPRYAAISNKPKEAFTGHTAAEMFPPEIAQEFTKNDMAAIESKAPLYTEEKIIFSDKHEEILDSVRTPIYDANGTLVGVLGFARNVTARVQIEKDLREAQLSLEQAVNDANRANEHKGEFLARMSHEIRTPMNAIIGLTNIVQKKLEGMNPAELEMPTVKSHVNQIESSSQHLLGLLNDILDISKIEAGKIELSEEILDLPKLINTVATIIKPRCDEKNITFNVSVDSFTPPTFLSDSLRLRQVLINLLGNAVKFTPELGRIDFRVTNKGRQEDKTLIEFTVADTGIGISEAMIENIFKPFEQADGKIAKRYGGTGLGLSISRRIVQLFGGNIAVKSTLGNGSVFSFEAWFKETITKEVSEKKADDATGKFDGKKVLLVDDVEINRMIVESLLEPTGVAIDHADDGVVAVQKFKDSPAGTYDIIFMDIQMPNMDGYEAAQSIRNMDRADAKTVPIVALTANAFKEDIDKALKHGMNDHITKPVEMERLFEVLFKYLPHN